jgi:hypothetical protein
MFDICRTCLCGDKEADLQHRSFRTSQNVLVEVGYDESLYDASDDGPCIACPCAPTIKGTASRLTSETSMEEDHCPSSTVRANAATIPNKKRQFPQPVLRRSMPSSTSSISSDGDCCAIGCIRPIAGPSVTNAKQLVHFDSLVAVTDVLDGNAIHTWYRDQQLGHNQATQPRSVSQSLSGISSWDFWPTLNSVTHSMCNCPSFG